MILKLSCSGAPFGLCSAFRLRSRDRKYKTRTKNTSKNTPTGAATAIASVLSRLLAGSLDDEDKSGVGLAAAVFVEDDGSSVAEWKAELADVVHVGGLAVNRAVAAVGNKLLASPLIRSQKSGRLAE